MAGRDAAAGSPRAHWWVLAVLMGLLVVGLALQGVADTGVGKAATRPATPGKGALPKGTGPLLDLSDGRIEAASVPDRTVVLTFDDGPDPTWTPRILDVLREEGVPATFFLVGARIGEAPDVTRRIHREGHEVGLHTFSHRNLTPIPGWQRSLEVSLNQVTLAGSIGVHSSLLRPPYSSSPAAFTHRDMQALQPLADRGYLVVLSDRDGRDWERPGVADIVQAATPPAPDGAVVLLHDGGGDRSQTVAALRRMIPRLKARGYRFATVSDVLAGRRATTGSRDAESEVGIGTRLPARAVVALQRASGVVVDVTRHLLVPLGLLTVARGLFVVVLARRHVRASRRRMERAWWSGDGHAVPAPASIVVPAYDEAAGIAAAVRSLAGSDHPDIEVIVVDDGSSDGTADIVDALALPNVRVVRQPNRGKPAAINAGVALARHDLIVCVDGDTVFEPATVGHLVSPFEDPAVGAVSGNTKVANRTGLIGRWQHLEYVMGFNLDRRMYEQLDCMPTVPGAIGAFRREALEAVGGVSDDTLAEDTDLTMAINRKGWSVVYEERAVAWTEVPASMNALWRQRYRWSYGTIQAMWKHRGAVRDAEHPGIGRRALPYLLVFQVILPVLAPIIDIWAIYGLLFLDPWPVLATWCAFTVVQLLVAGYAFRLDGEPLRPLWALPLQQVVYRQLMYLVVIQSIATALLGVRLPWQRVERTGAIRDVEAAQQAR